VNGVKGIREQERAHKSVDTMVHCVPILQFYPSIS
jgi:hypothetical protein